MNRRGFLAGILAAAAAPAIVRADALMKIVPRQSDYLYMPNLTGNWRNEADGYVWVVGEGGFLVPPELREQAKECIRLLMQGKVSGRWHVSNQRHTWLVTAS